jgi:hypothetical protein
MSLELVHCFFCKQTYQAEVEYDKETGILLPHLDSQLECPNKDCPSHAQTLTPKPGCRFATLEDYHESENDFKSNSAAQSAQKRISVATIIAYSRFRRECLAYHHSLANYLMLMHWIDERRIEMQAEGRRHWVPSIRDFEQAMRDCWDDLVGQPATR